MTTDQSRHPQAHRSGAHVFVSYAREDEPIASRIQHELLTAGAASVWLDRKAIEGGDDWKREINEGLLKTQVLVAVLTPSSIDPRRQWIRYEHAEASRLLRPIVPLLFGECQLPEHLRDIQYVDFRHDWHEGFVALLNALGKLTLRAGERAQKFTDHSPPAGRGFIGREEDLRRVFALIEGDSRRVATGRRSVAIQGMGGCGKTMLAEELVRRLGVRYPGGVTVEQRGQSPESAQAVLQRWAKCILGVYPQPQWTVVDVRSELQMKYGELLVLLDDITERDFDDVEQLLKALPVDATRLLTTRSKEVDTLGAIVYPLPELTEQDALAMLRDRLRAKGEEPDVDILLKLVQTVGGHALSMELIAGRCKHTGDLARQVEKLARRLEAGDVGSIALNAMGKSMRKDYSVALSLQESFEGLEEYDREAGTDWAGRFRALGVFPDGAMFERQMALAVWGDKEADDAADEALDGLSGRAMLDRDGTTGLYFNHPLLRAYGCGLLAAHPVDRAAAWDRYVRHIMGRAITGFSVPPEQWASTEVLAPHILHIAAERVHDLTVRVEDVADLWQPVAKVAPPFGDDGSVLARDLGFTQAVKPYVIRRPETGDRGRRCLELGLCCARLLEKDSETIEFLTALGRWYDQREPHLAERYYESAAAIAEPCGARAEWAAILTYNGELQRKLSRPEKALELLTTALAMHEKSGNRALEAMSLRCLGETEWRLGRHDVALDLHRRALAILVSIGDRSGQGDLLNKIGSVRFNQGRHEEAIKLFNEALHIHREVGNRSMEAEDLNDMGVAYRYLGDVDNALPRLVDAFITHRAIGSRRLQAISMCNLASVYLLQGLLKAAFELASDAVAIAREMSDVVTESWALSYKALALEQQGQLEPALPLFEEALARSRQVGDRRSEAGHLGNLAHLVIQLGQSDKAVELIRQAIGVMDSSGLAQAFGGRRREDFDSMLVAAASAQT